MVTIIRLLALLSLVTLSMTAYGQNKPNILVIWGNDIGKTMPGRGSQLRLL